MSLRDFEAGADSESGRRLGKRSGTRCQDQLSIDSEIAAGAGAMRARATGRAAGHLGTTARWSPDTSKPLARDQY